MRIRPVRERGLSLLEVTASITMLAVAVIGLMAAIAATSHLDQQSKERLLAVNAAREVLDTVRAQPYRVIGTNDSKIFDVVGLQPMPGQSLPGRITVNTLAANLVEVVVTIEWKGLVGRGRLIFRTLVTDLAPRVGFKLR